MSDKKKLPGIPDEIIMSRILLMRDMKVMLDSDLAELYGVETKRLNEQVKRNQNRFPPDFMFRLSQEEKAWVVANCDHLEKLKYSSTLPYAFSEYGAVMLASILNSERAIEANIQIVRIFIRLRQVLTENTEVRLEVEKIKKKLENQGKNIELLFNYLDELIEKQENPVPRKEIGFKPGKGK